MTVIKMFLILCYFFLRSRGDDLTNMKIDFFTQGYIYFYSITCLQKVNKVYREDSLHSGQTSFLNKNIRRKPLVTTALLCLTTALLCWMFPVALQRSFVYHEWAVKIITVDLQSNGCNRRIIFFWYMRLHQWINWSRTFGLWKLIFYVEILCCKDRAFWNEIV
jgi:hypothetical protein